MRSTYRGSPYGASPISLYSPELTLNPVKYVNAEYSSPSECGNRSSWVRSMRLPRPTPYEAVAHSPTPSSVKIAASSNGDGKNALAACDSWCSVNTKRFV